MEKSTPFVSFVLLFYNQEKFVEEAVNGALSQSYDNCEIILSDDCSSDGTFQIIERVASNYIGNKRIIINRNETNLGLVRHINKVLFDLSQGDIICLAGGDDISLSNRVSDTVNYFLTYSNLVALTMSYQIINADSKIIGERRYQETERLRIDSWEYILSDNMMWGLSGLAFSRIVLDMFGQLNHDCQTEDSVLRFRSILIGEVLISSKIGLKYRIHGNNMSVGSAIFKLKTIPIAKQYKRDLDVAKPYLDSKTYLILNKKIQHYQKSRLLLEKQVLSSNLIQRKTLSLFKVIGNYIYKWNVFKSNFNIINGIKFFAIRLFNLLFYLYNKKKSVVIAGCVSSIGGKVNSNNFGDDINYAIVKFFSGGKTVVCKNNLLLNKFLKTTNYSCVGSIIDAGCIDRNTIIWGSGFMYGYLDVVPKQVLAVRGQLSRSIFLDNGIECPEVYGDPALLLPTFFPCNKPKKYKYGLIPHYIDFGLPNVMEFKEKYNNSSIVIDFKNYKNWQDVVIKINECEFILSSSLHGLVVADAYGVPNVWIKLSNNVGGGNFKYLDYFSSVNRTHKEPIDLMNKQIIPENISDLYPYVPIKFNKDRLLEQCPFLDRSVVQNEG